ncbi:protein kinase [Chloroflexota bacterium]
MLETGQVIGAYEVVSLIGQGGMATVYKAYHAKLDRFVAIKMMLQALQQEENFLARFTREARIIARLDHPNIVPIYDFSDYDSNPYLVMKYVEGETLDQVLKRSTLPLAEILRIMTAIAEALAYAHSQGVLHRDVKPSNIIIDQNGLPYLTDFGLARLAKRGESTLSQGTMIGTPHYISPEQALGQSELDLRTDVYSMGVVLYELVVGRVPFAGDTPFSIVHDHIYSPLPAPSQINAEIPPAVEAVLVRALAKEPAARYQSATELMVAFREAVAAENLSALDPARASGAAAALAQAEAQRIAQASTSPPPTEPDLHERPPQSSPAPGEDRRAQFHRERSRRKAERRHRSGRSTEWELNADSFENFGEKFGAKVESFAENVENWAEQFEEGFERGKKGRPLTEEEKVRQRIEARIEARRELFTHLGIFVMVMALLWVIWLLTTGVGGFPWPLIVMFGWGIGIVAHIFEYYNTHGGGADRREAEIQRELDRARERGQLSATTVADLDGVYLEKQKNEDLADRRVRLTDDGEFTDSFVDDLEYSEKDKRDAHL